MRGQDPKCKRVPAVEIHTRSFSLLYYLALGRSRSVLVVVTSSLDACPKQWVILSSDRPRMLMRQPQEHESNHRKQDVGIEDHAGIPRRKVVRLDHLHEVRTAAPNRKHAGPTTAAVRISKLPRNARNPTTANPNQ